MGNLIRIQTYSDEASAETAKNFLAVHGISALLSSDNAGGVRPELTLARGIKLWVSDEDEKKARDILSCIESGQLEIGERMAEGEPSGFLTAIRKWFRGQL